jgi:hypothetical protein
MISPDYTVDLIIIHLESAFLADGYAQSGREPKSLLVFIVYTIPGVLFPEIGRGPRI